MNKRTLRRMFEAYNKPGMYEDTLILLLAELQKAEPLSWKRHVMDVMDAMECHDAGLFPDEWWDEISDKEERGPLVILYGESARRHMDREEE